MEADPQRLGDRSGINACRVGLVIESIRRRIPELGIVAEPAFLLLGHGGDGHFNLNPRRFILTGFARLGVSARDRPSARTSDFRMFLL